MVTLTGLCLTRSFSGGGKKSLTILTLPIGSSDNFLRLRFIIYFLPLSPVACTYDPDYIASPCKTHCHYTVEYFTETKVTFFTMAMIEIHSNNTFSIHEGLLCIIKIYSVF